MIKQKKETNAPESLARTKSYDGEDVKKQLLTDQSGKCYLCERVLTTDFEIEHLKSETHFPTLIQDWSNLFLSCRYCNGKKLENYDDILNPLETEVENVIKQEIDFQGNKAMFTNPTADEKVSKTIQLLNSIYNGTNRCRKIKEERFFEHILSTINDFSKLVRDYLDNPSNENMLAVKEELSISKEALGFKYWIIKSNSRLESEFASEIVWNKFEVKQ